MGVVVGAGVVCLYSGLAPNLTLERVSICVSVYPSVYLFVYLYIRVSAYPFI